MFMLKMKFTFKGTRGIKYDQNSKEANIKEEKT